jgi:hypothetical protein
LCLDEELSLPSLPLTLTAKRREWKVLPSLSAGYRLFKQREIAADLKETVFRLSDTTYSVGLYKLHPVDP